MNTGHTENSYDALLVYGQEATRREIVNTLRNRGVERVLASASAREAISLLLDEDFDIVIVGEELEDTDCWRFVRMIRSGHFCSSTLPIVTIGDGPPSVLRALARDNGTASVYLPEEMELLAEIVNSTVEGMVKPSVLVIEDDKHSANLAKYALEKRHSVEIASDGESGLRIWHERRHDLVLLDLMLPSVMQGPDVLREILNTNPSQPLVIITGYGTIESHRELMLEGAADFITKPFTAAHLRQICDRILRYKDYTDNRDEIIHKDNVDHEISKRIAAASYCLDTGRAGLARQQIKNAAAICKITSMTDDEWIAILNDYRN